MENPQKNKWYQTTWASILFLFLFFPVGLFLMWKYAKWPKAVKWVITGLFALFIIAGAFNDSPETATSNTQQEIQQVEQDTTSPEIQETSKPATDTVEIINTAAPTQAKQEIQKTTPATSETVSQKNAVKKAKSYLNYTGFSRDGLVDQLVYEQFSNADAIYGADNAGANWNEQAAKKAQSYMDYSAYSRGSLIEQLKYEKFTQAQAEYGANAVGL